MAPPTGGSAPAAIDRDQSFGRVRRARLRRLDGNVPAGALISAASSTSIRLGRILGADAGMGARPTPSRGRRDIDPGSLRHARSERPTSRRGLVVLPPPPGGPVRSEDREELASVRSNFIFVSPEYRLRRYGAAVVGAMRRLSHFGPSAKAPPGFCTYSRETDIYQRVDIRPGNIMDMRAPRLAVTIQHTQPGKAAPTSGRDEEPHDGPQNNVRFARRRRWSGPAGPTDVQFRSGKADMLTFMDKERQQIPFRRPARHAAASCRTNGLVLELWERPISVSSPILAGPDRGRPTPREGQRPRPATIPLCSKTECGCGAGRISAPAPDRRRRRRAYL